MQILISRKELNELLNENPQLQDKLSIEDIKGGKITFTIAVPLIRTSFSIEEFIVVKDNLVAVVSPAMVIKPLLRVLMAAKPGLQERIAMKENRIKVKLPDRLIRRIEVQKIKAENDHLEIRGRIRRSAMER